MVTPIGGFRRTGLLATTALVSCLWAAAANAQLAPGALPTQGQVVAGQSTISQSGNQMTINQGSQRSVINWGTFNIGSSASVTFNQPNAQAASLNRVVGNDPSQIFGRLSANGQVYLINPSGILFGAGSRVDVAGLVASTANISDREFMTNTSGRFAFDQAGRADAAIVNRGEITVREAGVAAFVAPGVENSGTISASLGRVGLASANTFTLDLYGDRLINIAVNDRVMGNAVDAQGNPVRAGVENSGRIMADGGRVEVSANVARGVVDNVIRMGGIVQARSASVARNGDIILDGGDGAVEVTGQLDASGRGAGQTGGRVRVRGERINIMPTVTVDVSGDAGGGSMQIGGGFRGTGPEPHAQNVTIAAGARLNADAINTGRGGTIVVWSDGTTIFNGAASARGGATSGDGGLVETSGHYLGIGATARIDASAANGAAGTWLLDPVVLTAEIGGLDTLACASEPCVIDPSVIVNALDGTNVTLNASSTINIKSDIDASGNTLAGSLFLEAPVVNLDASIIVRTGSDIGINATGPYQATGLFFHLSGGLSAQGGQITIHQNAGGSIQSAINAVINYDEVTINVGAGVFAPFHIDRHDITINGARRDLDPTNLTSVDESTQTIIDAFGSDTPGILITGNYATVNGVTIIGSRTAGILVQPDDYSYSSEVHGTLILNNYIRWNTTGIILGRDGGYGGVYATVIDRNRIEENNLTPYGTAASFGHGIVLRGRTGISYDSLDSWDYYGEQPPIDEGTAISRNLIINNVGHGIYAPSFSASGYEYTSYNHFSLAIVGNRIVNPGETGIQFGGLDTTSFGGYGWYDGYDRPGGTLSGAIVVLNSIENAFACSAAGAACQAITGFSGEGGGTTPITSAYTAIEPGLRGAIDFRDLYIERYFNGFGGEFNDQPPAFITGLLALGLGQAGSLLGLGVPTSDIVAMFNGPYNYYNYDAGYYYSQPSVYIGFNAISGGGYGVAIHHTVDLGETVVYINNNHLAANANGGLLYALTASYYSGSGYGSGSGSGSGSGYGYGDECDFGANCYGYETGRVVAAGNWWGDQNQNIDTSPAALGNLGPTFTSDVFANTGFRADIQGTGALAYWYSGYGGEGVVVSAWRLDGNNQVGRLNELVLNGQNLFNAGSEYPFPISLVVGGQLAGYLPTNTVRVGAELQYLGEQNYPNSEAGVFDVFRGPGAWDAAGRITRGVSVIREPLPLLASLIGTTISGGTDNGIVDVLPGHYWNEGSSFVSDWNGDYGVVLVDKNNLTIQATVFGVQTPGTPAGLIPGTAGAFSYNPDDFDGTLAGRAFPFGDPNFPTRNGSDFPTNTYEAVLHGGIVVVPNVVRGLIGALASGAETPEAGLSAFSTAAATNNFTLSGMVIAGGFNPGQLQGYFGGYNDYKPYDNGFAFGPLPYGYYDLPTIGVLLASGQNHTIRNNRILQYYDYECGEGCTPARTVNVQSNGYGGEGSIGILIAPGDALLAGLAAQIVTGGFGGEVPLGEIALPTPPATGSNTVIAQNDIVGWNTAGIMVGIPGLVELNIPVAPATGVQILRNAIMETCTYGCYVPEGVFGIQQIGSGGAAIVLSEGTGATVQNNWVRNNEIGVVNLSEGPVVINENSFESQYGTVAIENLAANPLSGINNWLGQESIFGLTQTVSNFTDTSPAPDRFDHNPLLPGWQIGASAETTQFTDPTFGRIPADGPFSFLADPFNVNQPLGGLGGAGPSLQDIAPAAGGQGTSQDQCANVPGEQLANILLGGFNLLNPAVYQQVIRCQAAAAQ